MPERFDAIIIGGGPGGSSAATFLAKANRRVLILEKERFPRFHIGESLLPYNRRIFEEMGVLPTLESAGFPIKLGAQFHIGNASKSLKLTFSNGRFTRETMAFQVERAKFDHILLKHAAHCGAEVREETAVTSYSVAADGVTVEARSANGVTNRYAAGFLVDASGRANLTGNQERLRVIHPRLRKLAVFGHFEGVKLDAGPKAGDTVIVRLENKWFWLIPISRARTSVGCVMDQEEFAKFEKNPAKAFDGLVRGSTAVRRLMSEARLAGAIQTTSDFSYYNRRLVSHRLLRVGDAAGFMDPIFSAGVYLAMYSGKLAAGLVAESIQAGHDGSPLIKGYEREVFRVMRFYWEMVEGFYTQPFLELFMEPRPRFNLPDAITAILAGEVKGGWGMTWRKRLFFLLTKLQGKQRIVPEIDFAEEATQEAH